MKKITLFITVLIFALNTNAQNDLWPTDPINTGSNSTYLVQDVSFNNGNLVYGILGAFFINDSGALQCGGWVTWSNDQASIAVWADDTTTDEKDGFTANEEITWLATNDNGVTSYEASVEYAMGPTGMGTGSFATNSVNIISAFTISDNVYCVNVVNDNGICDENEAIGCTDASAFNYNPNATTDDGSCVDVVEGCTDENADNYNSEANTDDGTCSIAGCMNEEAQNYNELATTDDGSCIIDGCTDETAFNYNADATVNDDSCLDDINLEYDTVPTSTSTNFNILANSISLTLDDSNINTEDVIGAFQIINGELVCVGYNPWEEGDMAIALWEDDQSTPEVDGYVSSESIYWMANQNSTGMNYLLEVTINESNIITNITVNTNVTLGCTEENAFNYTAGAIEDGSCVEVVEGCIDENACGYNATANTDDGSCYTLAVELSISDINTFTVDVSSTNSNDVLSNPTYTWYLDGIETGGVINGMIIQTGEYTLTVTDDLGCEQSSSALQANLSVNEVIDNNIVIYPNPANSVINISSNNSDIHSFDLYNAIGELMLSKSKLNSKSITINRNELKSGIYISKITDADGNSVIRNIIFE